MATFRKRGKRWQAIVRKAGSVPQSKTFATKGQAKVWADALERSIESGTYDGQALLESTTLKELLDNHLAHLERVSNRDRRVVSDYRTVLNGLGSDLLLSELDYDKLLAFCRMRADVDGVKGATIHQNILMLSGAITSGVLEMGLPSSFKDRFASWRQGLARAKMTSLPASRTRRVTLDELQRIKTHLKHNLSFRINHAEVIDFAIESCMRLGEIVRLAVADYNAKDGTIIVRQRKHPVRKTDEVVPLMGRASAIIDRRIAEGATKGGRIFPYNEDAISMAFTRVTRRVGIEDLHFHDLRHEGISRLFERGYQIQEVAMVSGHKDWGSLRRYVNLKASDIAGKDRRVNQDGH